MTGRENAIVLDERRAAWISPSVFMRGKIMASEDLVIDGTFEGTIDVGDHALTIGQSATVTADLLADTITICGTVVGNVTARARLELRATSSVEGTVKAPNFAMADASSAIASSNILRRRAGIQSNATRRTTSRSADSTELRPESRADPFASWQNCCPSLVEDSGSGTPATCLSGPRRTCIRPRAAFIAARAASTPSARCQRTMTNLSPGHDE